MKWPSKEPNAHAKTNKYAHMDRITLVIFAEKAKQQQRQRKIVCDRILSIPAKITAFLSILHNIRINVNAFSFTVVSL